MRDSWAIILSIRARGRNETVAQPGQSLDECRTLRIVAQRYPDLPDTEVQALFKIDKRLMAPNGRADLIPGDERSRIGCQQCQYPRGLLLNPDPLTFPLQFERAGIQTELSKTDQRHASPRNITQSWQSGEK